MVASRRSIWVFHLNTGGCNACDIEVLDLLAPVHDVERFGIKLVASPRHADVLLVTGPINVNVFDYVLRTLEAVPDPKTIVAIGSCACGGGVWFDSYATIGGVPKLLEILEERGIPKPSVVYVPGCPPKPEAMIFGLAVAANMIEKKQRFEYVVAEPSTEDRELLEVLRNEALRNLGAASKLLRGG